MPLTWEGEFARLPMAERVSRGADKGYRRIPRQYARQSLSPKVRNFGSQAIVVSIDSGRDANGHPGFIDGGRTSVALIQ